MQLSFFFFLILCLADLSPAFQQPFRNAARHRRPSNLPLHLLLRAPSIASLPTPESAQAVAVAARRLGMVGAIRLIIITRRREAGAAPLFILPQPEAADEVAVEDVVVVVVAAVAAVAEHRAMAPLAPDRRRRRRRDSQHRAPASLPSQSRPC